MNDQDKLASWRLKKSGWPELDIESKQFNALKALRSPLIQVTIPIRNAPIYYNIAEFESKIKIKDMHSSKP